MSLTVIQEDVRNSTRCRLMRAFPPGFTHPASNSKLTGRDVIWKTAALVKTKYASSVADSVTPRHYFANLRRTKVT